MSRPKTENGQGRPYRTNINISGTLYDATAMDRETGRFNDKVNRVLNILYSGQGRTDSIQILKAEYLAEIGRLQALVASLDAQAEAVEQILAQEARVRKAEEDFRAHVRLAKERGAEFKHWLHPGRADVKAVGGLSRAKRLMTEEGVNP